MSNNEDKKGWGILIAVFLVIALLWGYHALRTGMTDDAESSVSDATLTEIIASADSAASGADSERKSKKKRKRKSSNSRRKSARSADDGIPYRDILSDTITQTSPETEKL